AFLEESPFDQANLHRLEIVRGNRLVEINILNGAARFRNESFDGRVLIAGRTHGGQTGNQRGALNAEKGRQPWLKSGPEAELGLVVGVGSARKSDIGRDYMVRGNARIDLLKFPEGAKHQ